MLIEIEIEIAIEIEWMESMIDRKFANKLSRIDYFAAWTSMALTLIVEIVCLRSDPIQSHERNTQQKTYTRKASVLFLADHQSLTKQIEGN